MEILTYFLHFQACLLASPLQPQCIGVKFWATNPSIDFSVMKSDFKCHNWILSVLISEQNTHPQRHTWTIENSKQHTLHHHIMVCLRWRFHNTWIFVQYSSLKVCCLSFVFVFYLSSGSREAPFCQPSPSTWPLQTNWRMESAYCQEVSRQEVTY